MNTKQLQGECVFAGTFEGDWGPVVIVSASIEAIRNSPAMLYRPVTVALAADAAREGVAVARHISCDCHPETCCCAEAELLIGGNRVATGTLANMQLLAFTTPAAGNGDAAELPQSLIQVYVYDDHDEPQWHEPVDACFDKDALIAYGDARAARAALTEKST